MRFEAKRDIKTGEMRYDEKKRNTDIDDVGFDLYLGNISL